MRWQDWAGYVWQVVRHPWQYLGYVWVKHIRRRHHFREWMIWYLPRCDREAILRNGWREDMNDRSL